MSWVRPPDASSFPVDLFLPDPPTDSGAVPRPVDVEYVANDAVQREGSKLGETAVQTAVTVVAEHKELLRRHIPGPKLVGAPLVAVCRAR